MKKIVCTILAAVSIMILLTGCAKNTAEEFRDFVNTVDQLDDGETETLIQVSDVNAS